jgi:hypothetical protein
LIDRQLQRLEQDRAELRHVRYGLLNVDVWTTKLADVIAREIEQVQWREEWRTGLRAAIEQAIGTAVGEASRSMAEDLNRSLPASIRAIVGIESALKRATDVVLASGAFKAGTSTLSDRAVEMLNREFGGDRLRAYLRSRLAEHAEGTFGTVADRPLKSLLETYLAADVPGALTRIDAVAGKLRQRLAIAFALAALCLAALVGTAFRTRSGDAANAMALVVASSALLVCAVSLPMITIEATISRLAFALAGQWIEFQGQVLFHQSKSIFGVAAAMLASAQAGPVLLATLVIAFGILLPAAKLSGSLFVILTGKVPSGRAWRYLIVESDKWSLANVLVAAIFMAYLGFNGVIDYQLSDLRQLHPDLSVITRNDTSLGTGFYLFLGYSVAGTLLGSVLGRAVGGSGSAGLVSEG